MDPDYLKKLFREFLEDDEDKSISRGGSSDMHDRFASYDRDKFTEFEFDIAEDYDGNISCKVSASSAHAFEKAMERAKRTSNGREALRLAELKLNLEDAAEKAMATYARKRLIEARDRMEREEASRKRERPPYPGAPSSSPSTFASSSSSSSSSTTKPAAPSKTPAVLAVEKLDNLIGMDEVKVEIKRWLKRIQGQKKLERLKDSKLPTPVLHSFLIGPAGVGKTELARLMKEILYTHGVIKENKIVEVDAGGLIAEHVGGTALKVKGKVEEALGGVLFIDEAYSLHTRSNKNGGNFAGEALDTLIKEMEDKKDNLVVIFAGYDGDMEKLYAMNQGLKSRVPHVFYFQNYTPDEISQIAFKMLRERGYSFADEVKDEVKKAVLQHSRLGIVEGNGRFARNLVDKVSEEHLIRLADTDPSSPMMLVAEDVSKPFSKKSPVSGQDGLKSIQEDVFKKIDKLVGLENAKSQLKRMMDFFAVQQMRFEANLLTQRPTMHMAFLGEPGTCKTTFARIVGEFFRSTGYLSKGHFLEVSKADLISSSVGETPTKVKEVIKKAKGGVLFLDEAYSLTRGGFGQEAIDTFIKEIEDNRDDLVVIVAGYKKEMEEFFALNPGFKSRIPHSILFDNYTADEIFQIAEICLKENNYVLEEDAKEELRSSIRTLADKNGGKIRDNGRWARNLVDQLNFVQSYRIMSSGSTNLSSIIKEDIVSCF